MLGETILHILTTRYKAENVEEKNLILQSLDGSGCDKLDLVRGSTTSHFDSSFHTASEKALLRIAQTTNTIVSPIVAAKDVKFVFILNVSNAAWARTAA